MTDIKQVAEGLTGAQRKALLAMTDRWQRPSRSTFTHGAAWGLHWNRPMLADRARVGRTMANAHDEFRLTDTGLALRDYLLDSGGCDG